MKRLLTAFLAVFFAFSLQAQDDRFDALGAKLDEYFAALAGILSPSRTPNATSSSNPARIPSRGSSSR